MKDLSKNIVKTWKQKVSEQLSPLLSITWLGGLIIAASAICIFYFLAEEILHRETITLDATILQSLESWHSPLLDKIEIAITFLGEPEVLTFWCVTFSIFSLSQRKWAATITIVVLAAGGISLNHLLKNIFSRARPELWNHIIEVNNYSFPSGHAMTSLIIYGFLGYWFSQKYFQWRSLIISITVLLISAIGFSRLYLGVHWPTDIIAGYAAGILWLLACIFSLELLNKTFFMSEGWEKQ
jgi:membrane-associated phospholipid phosphatase